MSRNGTCQTSSLSYGKNTRRFILRFFKMCFCVWTRRLPHSSGASRMAKRLVIRRFQGRNRYDSFTYPQTGGFSLTHDSRVCLSKIGSIKVKLHHPIEGKVKICTIKYEAGQWFVIFSCEYEQPEPLPVVESEIGIDLGVTHFAALSDGTFIDNPRHLRKGQATLERRQQEIGRASCRERV